MQKFIKNLPGIFLCLIIAIIAELIHSLFHTLPLEPIIVAILLGILIGFFWPGLNTRFKEGINFSAKKILPIAIVFLGAQLNLFTVLRISLHALIINVICVIIIFFVTLWLCHIAKINKHLGILIGIGTAICGSTAIVVAAPVIKARTTEIAIAITTITLFGTLAIFLYPIIGHALHLSQWKFGVWAGTAIQAVPQVIAAGFAYGTQAGKVGTVVKLVRILFLAPMILALGIWQSRQKDLEHGLQQVEKVSWQTYVPPFILGFILFVILSTLGVFRDFTIFGTVVAPLEIFKTLASFLLTIAMAAIGLSTDLHSFIKTGIKSALIGFLAAILLAIISLLLLHFY